MFGTQELLARLVEQYWTRKATYFTRCCERPRHQPLYLARRTYYEGYDLFDLLRHPTSRNPGVQRPFTRRSPEVKSWNDYFHSAEQVKYALFERYGWLAAAGDRHLAEFVPGFLVDEETIYRYGFSRTPMSYRYGRWHQLAAFATDHRRRHALQGAAFG